MNQSQETFSIPPDQIKSKHKSNGSVTRIFEILVRNLTSKFEQNSRKQNLNFFIAYLIHEVVIIFRIWNLSTLCSSLTFLQLTFSRFRHLSGLENQQHLPDCLAHQSISYVSLVCIWLISESYCFQPLFHLHTWNLGDLRPNNLPSQQNTVVLLLLLKVILLDCTFKGKINVDVNKLMTAYSMRSKIFLQILELLERWELCCCIRNFASFAVM